MRFESWIHGQRVMVLIDSGYTHNFISQEMVKKLNFNPTIIEPFSVRVANGEQMSCKETYRKIPIQVQGITLIANLFSLPLEGIDVVLGIQWLESLGQVTTDYGAGTMEFSWEDGRVVLKAGASEPIREVNIDTVERIVRQGGSCYGVKIEKAGLGVEGKIDSYHPEIKQVQMRFSNVL